VKKRLFLDVEFVSADRRCAASVQPGIATNTEFMATYILEELRVDVRTLSVHVYHNLECNRKII
jgi:hypothetical protein